MGDSGDALPIRGGIDFGLGLLVDGDDFVVSPALARAYQLESTAVYARIVVGTRIHRILQSAEAFGRTSDKPLITRMVAVIRSMLHKDNGITILDFFGRRMSQVYAASQVREIASAAWTYVNACETKHRTENRESIAAKYKWLVDYMRPRLPLWGVSEESASAKGAG